MFIKRNARVDEPMSEHGPSLLAHLAKDAVVGWSVPPDAASVAVPRERRDVLPGRGVEGVLRLEESHRAQVRASRARVAWHGTVCVEEVVVPSLVPTCIVADQGGCTITTCR